jgi:hypothetical protein
MPSPTATSLIPDLNHTPLGRDPDPPGLYGLASMYPSGLSRADLFRVLRNTYEARWTEFGRSYQDELGRSMP